MRDKHDDWQKPIPEWCFDEPSGDEIMARQHTPVAAVAATDDRRFGSLLEARLAYSGLALTNHTTNSNVGPQVRHMWNDATDGEHRLLSLKAKLTDAAAWWVREEAA